MAVAEKVRIRLAFRHDPKMSEADRNSATNLIWLCPNHHTVIDKSVQDWPAEKLLDMKATHEGQVREALEQSFADVSFEELKQAVAQIYRSMPTDASDFTISPPDQKLLKNSLSEESRFLIISGLACRKAVTDFVRDSAQLDADYPERLKAGFLEKYHALRREGHQGDDLFDLMCDFAQQGMRSNVTRAAGIAVLVYLFEICDVFEK